MSRHGFPRTDNTDSGAGCSCRWVLRQKSTPLQPADTQCRASTDSQTLLERRLLQRFIKSAAGERASDLRVSLSGGSLVLANLELNLDALLRRLPLRVERAYARQLRVTVPWTALATQPIQARSAAASFTTHS